MQKHVIQSSHESGDGLRDLCLEAVGLDANEIAVILIRDREQRRHIVSDMAPPNSIRSIAILTGPMLHGPGGQVFWV
jgi:hypothetical protein